MATALTPGVHLRRPHMLPMHRHATWQLHLSALPHGSARAHLQLGRAARHQPGSALHAALQCAGHQHAGPGHTAAPALQPLAAFSPSQANGLGGFRIGSVCLSHAGLRPLFRYPVSWSALARQVCAFEKSVLHWACAGRFPPQSLFRLVVCMPQASACVQRVQRLFSLGHFPAVGTQQPTLAPSALSPGQQLRSGATTRA